ncbi:MAG: hypothetical protein ACOCXS_00275 [Bacteroidota bacterium]
MVESIFQDIFNDNTSGSASVLIQVQNRLIEFAQNKETIGISFLKDELEKVQGTFPQFAAMRHFIKSLEDELITNTNESLSSDALISFTQNYKTSWKEYQAALVDTMINEIDFNEKNILLHSMSSSVIVLFDRLSSSDMTPVLYHTETRPAFEGRIEATILSNMGFKTNLITDAFSTRLINKIDFMVFGADVVFADSFINKAGTMALTLLAKHFKKPIYVIADKRKMVTSDMYDPEDIIAFRHEEIKPEKEIWSAANDKLSCINYYFEEIPLNHVTKLYV